MAIGLGARTREAGRIRGQRIFVLQPRPEIAEAVLLGAKRVWPLGQTAGER
jgi:hypothetical protein